MKFAYEFSSDRNFSTLRQDVTGESFNIPFSVAMAGIREVHYVSQAKLHKIAEQKGSIRAGSTIDPVRRAGEYSRDGYAGKMYASRTKNMMKAEDKILAHSLRHNDQGRSNAQGGSGHIYVLKGRKMQ